MPQKLNKAGQMQDYIPAGNGDASGEYGTSNGTNKNFTTSDKKSSKANVITENKSVVVGKKDKGYSEVEKADWGIKGNEKQIATLEKSGKYPDMLKRLKEQNEILKKQKQEVLDGKREKIDLADDGIERKEGTLPFGDDNSNKANIIDGDLTGKKEESFEDFYNNTFYTKDGNFYKKSALNGSVKKISQKDYELAKNMNDDLNKLGKENSARRTERIQKDTMEKVLNKKFIPFESVGLDIRDEFKKQVVNDFYKLHKDSNHVYTEEEVKKVVDSYNAWYSGSFTKQEIRNLTDSLNTIVK